MRQVARLCGFRIARIAYQHDLIKRVSTSHPCCSRRLLVVFAASATRTRIDGSALFFVVSQDENGSIVLRPKAGIRGEPKERDAAKRDLRGHLGEVCSRMRVYKTELSSFLSLFVSILALAVYAVFISDVWWW